MKLLHMPTGKNKEKLELQFKIESLRVQYNGERNHAKKAEIKRQAKVLIGELNAK